MAKEAFNYLGKNFYYCEKLRVNDKKYSSIIYFFCK